MIIDLEADKQMTGAQIINLEKKHEGLDLLTAERDSTIVDAKTT